MDNRPEFGSAPGSGAYCPRCRRPIAPGAPICPFCGVSQYRAMPPAMPVGQGRRADLVFGAVSGVLSAGLIPIYAVLLVLVTRGTGSGPGSWNMARMAVWGFVCIPPAVYISLMSSYGASALWTGPPGARWVDRFAPGKLLSVLPNDNITLMKSAGRGALGAILGLAALGVLYVVMILIAFVMVFLGPGLPILAVAVGVIALIFTAGAAWGAVLGAMIYCRRRFGWAAGVASAALVVIVCNALIVKFI